MKLCIFEIEIWIGSNKEIMNANDNTEIRHLGSNGFIYLVPEVTLNIVKYIVNH